MFEPDWVLSTPEDKQKRTSINILNWKLTSVGEYNMNFSSDKGDN